MEVHAIVHTTGVTLGRSYVPLEFAYTDSLGFQAHFLITSSIGFYEARRRFPHCGDPDVFMSTRAGSSIARVHKFLRKRYAVLSKSLGSRVAFGYKGNGFQARFLVDAGIPNIINLETLGVPPLPTLAQSHPRKHCPWHPSARNKCARHAVEMLVAAANVL